MQDAGSNVRDGALSLSERALSLRAGGATLLHVAAASLARSCV
jgi:hypothetical protein